MSVEPRRARIVTTMRIGDLLTSGSVPEPVRLGKIPTPLEYHSALSRDLGVELFLKREDAIDDLGCGNKLRKLDYLVADALRQEATVLVTAGSLPSNQCKAVAAVAARHGLRAHVLYGGDRQARPDTPSGSYLLTALLGPSVSWLEYSPWAQIGTHLEAVLRQEQERGERPYLIAPGASAWPGLLGSIELGLELGGQIGEVEVAVADVVAPAGSGGTCLGLSIAARLLGLTWRVFAVLIGGTISGMEQLGVELCREAEQRIGRPEVLDCRVHHYDGASGLGYDRPRPEELDTMRDVAAKYGLLFDPNYMVKAFLGLRRLIQEGAIQRGAAVVLVHTGGQFGVFGVQPELRAWYRSRLSEYLS